MLLTRDAFRNAVFERDNHRCVNCTFPAQDAHHIIERRLWDDGGYYLDNGASLCASCHLLAELTLITVEELRQKCRITKPVLPSHLYDDQIYDKWGNIILPNGQRLRGELFYDESVQKALYKVMHLFTGHVKFPRTWHLPWSPGRGEGNERTMPSTKQFEGRTVVVTEKMDGENSTVYTDYCHARALDSDRSLSVGYLKSFVSTWQWLIPQDMRVCGENLYLKHSIHYTDLQHKFLGFQMWDKDVCMDWASTMEWFQLLGVKSVPILYIGPYNEKYIQSLYQDGMEGYVVRLADSFRYGQYREAVGKYVRAGHVQTSHHWKRETPVLNQTKEI